MSLRIQKHSTQLIRDQPPDESTVESDSGASSLKDVCVKFPPEIFRYFSSPVTLVWLRFNLKAVVVVYVWIRCLGPPGSRPDQVYESHQWDRDHGHHAEEDDDGKDPVGVGLSFSFGKLFLKSKKGVKFEKKVTG